MVKVSVVILNWNGEKDTFECLKSIYKSKLKNLELEVIVVDNGSTNDIKMLSYKDTVILRNEENLGFAEGNNVGIRHALESGANYIMILNNDTEISENLISNLVKVMETDKEIGIASPKIYFAKGFEFHKDRYRKDDLGKVIWYAGGVMDWDNIYGSNRGVDEVDHGQYDETTNTDFATGACMIVRSETIKDAGMFNKKYFLYLEDADLSERIKKTGWKAVYTGAGFLWHKVSQSSGIGSELNDYFITRNRMLFGMKYARVRTKIALFRESIKILLTGRKWQKMGIIDFYQGRFEKGSWT